MTKEVIILGRGPSREDCPYDKEVWAVNDGYAFAKRIDKLFLTDGWQEFSVDELNEAKQKFGFELITATPHEDLDSTLYPIEEVLHKFPTQFFTNTICYMLAYALLKGYKRLYLYGIDMLTHTSYIHEKGGVEYWMGVALGMGVEVVNTERSETGKTMTGMMYGEWGNRTQMIQEITNSFSKKQQKEVVHAGII